MGWLFARLTGAASLGLAWMLSPSSPAVAEATQPPSKDNGFDFDFVIVDFPHSATRVMYYVLAGVIVFFTGALIGLVVYRGRADKDSGFSRSGP